MGGRFGKYGDIKRKNKIRKSGTFGKTDSKIIHKPGKKQRTTAITKIKKSSA
jgi:hypothetical protein